MESSRTPSFRGWSKLLFCVSAIAILYAFLPTSIPVARAAIAHCQFDDTSGFLHGFHGKLEDASACEVRPIGVNWFGFETRTFSPHGLWARNWQEMLDQIAQAGFNTLRLPFSNQLFDPSSKPQGIDYKLNPDLKGLSGLALLDRIIEGGRRFPMRLSHPDKLAYSAHDYGPGVYQQSWFQVSKRSVLTHTLPAIWQKHWAYLQKDGIAPVLLGEFGGRSVGQDREGVWQNTLMGFLNANDIGYTYWAWNADSGDTGGILRDDWSTLNQSKL